MAYYSNITCLKPSFFAFLISCELTLVCPVSAMEIDVTSIDTLQSAGQLVLKNIGTLLQRSTRQSAYSLVSQMKSKMQISQNSIGKSTLRRPIDLKFSLSVRPNSGGDSFSLQHEINLTASSKFAASNRGNIGLSLHQSENHTHSVLVVMQMAF